MGDTRTLTLRIAGDAAGAIAGLDKVEGKMNGFKGVVSKIGPAIAGVFAIGGAKAGFDWVKDGIDAAKAYNDIVEQSTNEIGKLGSKTDITVDNIKESAGNLEGLSLIDEEEIIKGENTLVRYGVTSQKTLDKAAEIAANYAVQTGQSYGAASEMIGKALQNPTKGIAKLEKAGISFTDAEKKKIAALQKSGKVTEAQAIIMDKLNNKTKGAAAAQDPLKRAQFAIADAMGDLQRKIGDKLLPIISELAKWFAENLPKAIDWVMEKFNAVGTFISENADLMKQLGIVIGVAVAAFTVWTAVMTVFNAVMAMNPIVLIAIAIAGIIALLVVAYNKFAWFKNIVNLVFTGLKLYFQIWWTVVTTVVRAVIAAFGWLWDKIQLVFNLSKTAISGFVTAVKTAFTTAVQWIKDKWNAVLTFLAGLKESITSKASGMWDGFKDAFKGAINWIIDKWNGLSFTLPSFSAFGHEIGGATISVPNIPRLAAGGIIRARPGGVLANIGEGRYDEAVVPLNGSNFGGGQTIIQVTVMGNVTSERDLVTAVRDGLARDQKRNGRLVTV